MKRFLSKYSLELLCLLLGLVLMLSGCSVPEESGVEPGGDTMWAQITMNKAMELMETEESYIILDVRRPDEFAEGHIPGAVNLSNEIIGAAETAEDEEIKNILPDQEQLILVYCRSGNRSKQASQKLADLGYVHIVEFGGIQDWPGEIEY